MRVKTLLLAVSLAIPLSSRADTIYTTLASGTAGYWPNNLSSVNKSNNNTSSSVNGQYLIGTYYSEADRGYLHAFSTITNATGTDPYADALAKYTEYNVKAVTIGPPDLLQGIVAYKFTFNADGTVEPVDIGPYAAVFVGGVQDGTEFCCESSVYFADPIGPVSFYLKVPDPTQLFDFFAQLDAHIGNINGGYDNASVNFSNTVSLASVVAVDSQGNVIPGVELELSDGTYLGANGYSTTLDPITTTPEPSTFVMFGTGLFGVAGVVRRRLRA